MGSFAWRSEAEYRKRIFNLILFFASEEGASSLPNGEEKLLLAMAAAVVGHLGGDTSQITQSFPFLCSNWTQNLNGELRRVLEKNTQNIHANLIRALKDLLSVEWKSSHGECWWESGIRAELMYRQRGLGATFCLTHPEVNKIQESIHKYFNPLTVEQCQQIGALMRGHIILDAAAK